MTMTFNRRQAMQLGGASALAMSAGLSARAQNQGGHLRMGLAGGNTSDSFDGRSHTDAFMQISGMGAVFDCMTEVAADGSLKGELAESWEASADAKTWTFKLRKGVEFHNGKSFGADDVIESLQLHLGDDSTSAAKPIIEAVEEMKKDDDHTVRFSLKNGNADFPYLLSDYHILIYPAGMIDEAIAKGIGTGGVVNKGFDPGVRAEFEKNPNDYRDDRVNFDSVEIISISDGSARINALITGEVDVINKIEPATVSLLEGAPNVFISEVTGNQHYTFPMHTNTAPFDNLDVRMALKLAVNRQELVEKILVGHGAVGNDHPIGPANQYFDTDLEQRAYDPDKAKFHLKQAGLENFKIDLSVADAAFPGAVDAGVLYKEHAAAAGIDINLIREPNDGYWSNVWLRKPWCACYWSGRATEDWMFSTTYERGVPWNDTFWDHERFNKLLVEARVELDSDKRRDIYHEMQRITRDEGGAVIPMYANYIDAASTKLANSGTVGNAWQMDGCRLIERWWFA